MAPISGLGIQILTSDNDAGTQRVGAQNLGYRFRNCVYRDLLKKIYGTGQTSRLGKERVLGIGAIGSGW